MSAGADPVLWDRYCRLAAELEGRPVAEPTAAPGSVEWQRRQDAPVTSAAPPVSSAANEAGHRRLRRRGAPPPFAGTPSPFGAAGSDDFAAFLAQQRGSAVLLAEIAAIEDRLVAAFEKAGRAGRFQASGFCNGVPTEARAEWFARARLDFGRNAIVLPDSAEIAGIVVRIGANAGEARSNIAGRRTERTARAMLRQALIALWERKAFGAGTGNERVLALVLRELGLPPANPPYGLKSAETVRKLRKELGMSL